jgi:thymidylate synthase (FAD)
MSVLFIIDRGISHELVRHRLASFTQESTRYCNYSKDKFDNGITFIKPDWYNSLDNGDEDTISFHWHNCMKHCERIYLLLLEQGLSPQFARSVLPNSLKTEIVITTNFREWRHIFQLRAIEKAAHPQMRQLMIPLYKECKNLLPEIFNLGEPE